MENNRKILRNTPFEWPQEIVKCEKQGAYAYTMADVAMIR